MFHRCVFYTYEAYILDNMECHRAILTNAERRKLEVTFYDKRIKQQAKGNRLYGRFGLSDDAPFIEQFIEAHATIPRPIG